MDEAGAVTGVRIETEVRGKELLWDNGRQQALAALAFAAAQRSYNGLTWARSGVIEDIESQPFRNYTLQAGDVIITQQVELRGYEGYSDGDVLYAAGGADSCYYHMIFTMELDP